jgi:hypothetical protein
MLSEAGKAEIEKFGAGRTEIVQLAVTVPAADPEESMTFAEKLYPPAAVGVPIIAPVLAFRISPPGRFPVLEKAYGRAPPAAVSAEVYDTPT